MAILDFRIDHTKIDTTFNNTPVLTYLNLTNTLEYEFNELFIDSNTPNFRVYNTTNSGVDYYTEISYFNYSTKEMVLYINIPVLSGTAPTYFSIATGSGTVGFTGSTYGKSVWSSDFYSVYHMSQDPSSGGACVLDSTIREAHSTTYGTFVSDDLVEGLIDKAIQFNGIDSFVVPSSINMSSWQSMVVWCKPEAAFDSTAIAGHLGDARWTSYGKGFKYENESVVMMAESADSKPAISADLSVSEWHHIVGNFVSDGGLYVDGLLKVEGDLSDGNAYPFTIANSRRTETDARFFNGAIGEVWLLSIAVSQEWVKLMNFSQRGQLVYRVFPTVCSGTVSDSSNNPLPNITINLHRRATGELTGSTVTTNSGTFEVSSLYAENHYIVALPNIDNINALIYDNINPMGGGD